MVISLPFHRETALPACTRWSKDIAFFSFLPHYLWEKVAVVVHIYRHFHESGTNHLSLVVTCLCPHYTQLFSVGNKLVPLFKRYMIMSACSDVQLNRRKMHHIQTWAIIWLYTIWLGWNGTEFWKIEAFVGLLCLWVYLFYQCNCMHASNKIIIDHIYCFCHLPVYPIHKCIDYCRQWGCMCSCHEGCHAYFVVVGRSRDLAQNKG